MFPMFRRGILLTVPLTMLLASCSAGGDGLGIVKVIITDQQHLENQPLPESREIFPVGIKKVYVYAWLRNVHTQTKPFPLEMTWFSPNDFFPPIAKTLIELKPPQFIGEFVVPSDVGFNKSSHLVVIRAGNALEAQASARFYIGMTEEEIKADQDKEAAVRERQKASGAPQAAKPSPQGGGKKVIVNTEGE